MMSRTDAVAQMAVAGDTTSDLLAGHRAGASVVAGVRTGAHGDADFAAVPHTHVLDSVADLPRVLAEADAGSTS
jgi:phosphoglycolate phosphatase